MKIKTNVNRLIALSLVTILGIAASPQKSEAGVVLVLSATPVGYVLGSVFIGSGALTGILAANGDLDTELGLISAGVLLLLDADGAVPQDQLRAGLEKKYAFIENKAFFGSLSSLIKSKADSMKFDDQGAKRIAISRAELNGLLLAVDTTGVEAEIEQMIVDLK